MAERRRREPTPYVPRLPRSAQPPEQAIRRTGAVLTLAVRSGCALCQEARRLVEHSARRYRLALEVVDIERDHQEVFEKWKYELPVLLIDGKRRFSGHLSATLVEKALQARVG